MPHLTDPAGEKARAVEARWQGWARTASGTFELLAAVIHIQAYVQAHGPGEVGVGGGNRCAVVGGGGCEGV